MSICMKEDTTIFLTLFSHKFTVQLNWAQWGWPKCKIVYNNLNVFTIILFIYNLPTFLVN